jgi:hypothetical protein
VSAGVAVDNDVLLKAMCYRLEAYFWPDDEILGVLGAAKFVVRDRLAKSTLNKGVPVHALEDLIRRAEILEPEESEVALAAAIEKRASELGIELDGGESQLVALVVTRGIDRFETGDKRAIAGLEPMLDEIDGLSGISGRVRCLEQIAHRVAEDEGAFSDVAKAICGEVSVDRSLSTCFSCYSGIEAKRDSVLEALRSYISAVRAAAPTVLEAGP